MDVDGAANSAAGSKFSADAASHCFDPDVFLSRNNFKESGRSKVVEKKTNRGAGTACRRGPEAGRNR